MNSTCIHLSASGSYIYICTGGGEYTKNPLEKYNNRKTNTYLIVINLNCSVDGYEDFNYLAFIISLSYLDYMNGYVATACYVMARPHLLGVCSLSITQLLPIRKGLINE
jgi:hypothetical protein